MNNIFKQADFNQGFLKCENHIDSSWISSAIQKDDKLQEIINVAQNIKNIEKIIDLGIGISSKFKNIFIVGIGGSTLAGKALWHEYKNSKNNLIFIDNLDYDTVMNSLKNNNIDDSFFLFISKSGNTIETVSQMIVICQYLESFGLSKQNINHQSLVITANKNSKMSELAAIYQIEILEWSGSISGRMSVFSNNTNLISAIIGVDVKQTLRNVINIIESLQNDSLFVDRMNSTISSIKQGLSTTVLFCYKQSYQYFIEWYIQIWSESIGKSGLGTNPCGAIGPLDQHSKLQLYLGGPKDKIFTILNPVFQSHNKLESPVISNKNASIEGILNSAANATHLALCDNNSPSYMINCKMDEYFMYKIMAFYMLETILCCHYFNLNPYNQPEVENSKERMMAL
jgi:glucose-6-phosphate isomerase